MVLPTILKMVKFNKLKIFMKKIIKKMSLKLFTRLFCKMEGMET